jgi:hypothetical protein
VTSQSLFIAVRLRRKIYIHLAVARAIITIPSVCIGAGEANSENEDVERGAEIGTYLIETHTKGGAFR